MSFSELSVPICAPPSDGESMALGRGDPVEAVARVAAARRDRLLRVNRRRLRWEDLEDCYSQATLELVARAQRAPFASPEHIVNALEQKFSSRIDDRRRAIGGRSPIEAAIATALPVDAPEAGAGELEDRNAEVVRQVSGRIEVRRLREVACELTDDQRLVLACQISLGMDCAEFCRRFGWSAEKFRKVAQRARARLRALVAEYQLGERCRRLEPDLLAYSARTANPEQTRRATAHLANCTACASQLRALDRASRQVAALLPAPVVVKAGLLAKLGGFGLAARRVAAAIARPGTEAGAAGVAGGSAAGVGAVKLGVAAACLAGAAGGYVICAPVLPGGPARAHHHHARRIVATQVARVATAPPAAPALAPSLTARSTRPLVKASTQPVTGAAASAVAHREFGPATARVAAVIPRQPAPPASSSQPGAAPAPSGGPAGALPPAATGRAASQARAEFGGFER